MVLYFSGTGNSQSVAFQIAKIIDDDEIISINQFLKTGKKGKIQSPRPLVFVAPTYCWRIPSVVKQWILKTSFQGNQDAYFVLTCGGGCGNAEVYAKKLCAKKGLQFRGLNQVIMPENYLALFPTPSEAQSRTIMEDAQPGITAIAERIKAGQCLPKPHVSFGDKLKSGPVNPLFYAFFVHDKGFSVSDRCVSCGKCALRCSLNNLVIEDGKPIWKGNCTHCMACIGGCPTQAIEYKSKSKNQRRHYIMNDSLCWEERGQKH